jgi:putative cofactor-binding repeat protein
VLIGTGQVAEVALLSSIAGNVVRSSAARYARGWTTRDVRSTRVGNGKASGEPLPDGPDPGITLTVPAATGVVVRIRTGR